MIDFGGWWDNFEWSGEDSGKPPTWLVVCSVVAGAHGLGGVVASWVTLAVDIPAWVLALMLPGLILEVTTHAMLEEWRILPVAYGIVLFFAGMFALLALEIPSDSVRGTFAVYAPCLTVGIGPLTSRAVGATLFALKMVTHVKEEQERVRAALGGEGRSLLVRVERVDDFELTLTTLGESERTLRATWSVLGRKPSDYSGDHFLLDEPSIGDLEASDGYRDGKQMRRLVACKGAVFLGRNPRAQPTSWYWDEVRAGIVILTVGHAMVGLIAVILA